MIMNYDIYVIYENKKILFVFFSINCSTAEFFRGATF